MSSSRKRIHKHSAALALMCIIVLTTGGCRGRDAVAFVDQRSVYTTQQVREMARKCALGDVAGRPVSEASELRHERLSELREKGADWARAADVLTVGFPADTRSVPVRVEAASVDGVEAWVVVEAWGPRGGALDSRRVWVFDRSDGRVLTVATFR
ncbi:MAG: hypothetical protein WC971_03050 [Coriobacteriia bacterium]